MFAKIFEKLLANRVVNYLLKFKISSIFQYAYFKGKSVEMAIFMFLNAIYNALDQSYKCYVVFYDYSKAFDLIDHNILRVKLQALGIDGICLDLIMSCLNDRVYYVQVTGTAENVAAVVGKSGRRKRNKGVPQGSNLCPILFLIAVNDLPSTVLQKLCM